MFSIHLTYLWVSWMRVVDIYVFSLYVFSLILFTLGNNSDSFSRMTLNALRMVTSAAPVANRISVIT